MSVKDLKEALYGPKGAMDAYLEVMSEAEIRADVIAFAASSTDQRREHFAGLAMQGLLAAPQEVTGRSYDEVRASYARQAVAYADALLAELAKERP